MDNIAATLIGIRWTALVVILKVIGNLLLLWFLVQVLEPKEFGFNCFIQFLYKFYFDLTSDRLY